MKGFDDSSRVWREIPNPTARLSQNRFIFLKLLVPFFAAGLLYLWGRTRFGTIVAGIGLSLLLLKLIAPQTLDSLFALLSAMGRWLSKAVSFAVLSIAYGVIFTPIAFVVRLLRRDPLELTWQPSFNSYWVEVPQDDPTRFFDKPFLLETRRGASAADSRKFLRIGRAVYHTALTLFFLNLALGSLVWAIRQSRKQENLHPPSQLAAYAGDDWARDYFKEFDESNQMIYRPYLGWVRKDYKGRYINIQGGFRQTYHPRIDSKPIVRLYMFGASTTWGTGARDDYTIASFLAKLAEQQGIALDVHNYGESGYVDWQNVIHLAELCAEGKAPDLAIFYEGAGDAVATLQTPDLVRVHENFSDWQEWVERHDSVQKWFENHSLIHYVGLRLGRELGIEQRRASETIMSAEPARVQRLAHEIAATYEENAALVRKLSQVYGFRAAFFWQPVVHTKKHLTDVERLYLTENFGDLMGQVYRAATQDVRSRKFAFDISSSFDDQDRSIFIDWAHVSETGNRIVAENIYTHIHPMLQSIAGSRTRSDLGN